MVDDYFFMMHRNELNMIGSILPLIMVDKSIYISFDPIQVDDCSDPYYYIQTSFSYN